MLNTAIIQGRFTATPELRYTSGDKAVTSFTLAVSRNYKDKNGGEITDFINCVVWGKTAEFVARYFTKGALAIVKGAIEVRNYEDKEGNKRTATEINADGVYFCEGKKQNNETAPATAPDTVPAPNDFEEIDSGDDLPF